MTRVELRIAIWVAYGKKDIYTGRLIENFDDLEIDHIIPKSTDKTALKEKVNKYNLGGKFTIDSIENLVPTFKLYNREKSDINFDESSERFFLAIAKGKKSKVEEEWSKIIKNRRLKEKVQFKKNYRITNTEQFGLKPTYFNSDTLVALNGYLPSKFDESGSCAIEFYEMGTMVTLNHHIITTLINRNRYSVLEEQILHHYNDKNEKAFIIIGTSSLFLKKEAYDQLLRILEDFLTEYERFSQKFKSFLELNDFELFESEGCYRLREITQNEWDYLIAYSYKYDTDSRGESEFCFNTNPYSLIALERNEPIVKFTITSRTLDESQMNKLILLWHLPKIKERKFIEDGKVWTATQTLSWVNSLLDDLEKEKNTIAKNRDLERKSIISALMNNIKRIYSLKIK